MLYLCNVDSVSRDCPNVLIFVLLKNKNKAVQYKNESNGMSIRLTNGNETDDTGMS